jgi:hypothetical protein
VKASAFFIGKNKKAGQERDKMANQRKKGKAVIAETLAITGADDQNRTGDLLITNQLLYRLSYIGIHWKSVFH